MTAAASEFAMTAFCYAVALVAIGCEKAAGWFGVSLDLDEEGMS